jgi:hypothetical protein
MMIEEKLSNAKLRRSAIRDQYAAGSILALVVLEEDGRFVSLKSHLRNDFFHRKASTELVFLWIASLAIPGLDPALLYGQIL